MKKIIIAVLTLICMALVAGCGSSDTAAPKTAEKVLKVATNPQSPPFELYLEDRKEYTGFDIDLIRDLAKHMGYDRVEFINLPFDQLLPGLKENKYDIAMNNFSVTEARNAEYAPSEPYAKAGFAVVGSEKVTMTGTVEDFKNKKIAIMAGTSSERFARTFVNAEIVGYPSYSAALNAVTRGEADFAICGNLVAAYIMTHSSNHGLKVVGHSERQDDLAFYLNKNNKELLEKLNAAIHECKKSGDYKRLIEFYFGTIEKQ